VERELLLELGCEEIPASWLPSLTSQVGDALAGQLRERRLPPETAVETIARRGARRCIEQFLSGRPTSRSL
jgi:glycyl-tRNA synthetase beta subunit